MIETDNVQAGKTKLLYPNTNNISLSYGIIMLYCRPFICYFEKSNEKKSVSSTKTDCFYTLGLRDS